MGHDHHHGERTDAETLAKADGAFHDELASDYAHRVQWDSVRNQEAHKLIHKAVESFGKGTWAEVGAGLSLDGEALSRRGIRMIALDPSLQMVRHALARMAGKKLPWSAMQAQGAALPFKNNTLDGVLWVASLHHLPDPPAALAESARAVRPGGGIVVGMEPASWWHEPMERMMDRLRPKLAKGGRFREEGSPADHMGEGFNEQDFREMAQKAGLEVVSLTPVWLSLGFVHVGLEAAFRLLKLRNRVRLPGFLEKGLWLMDSGLAKVPGVKRACWHWVAVFRKPV